VILTTYGTLVSEFGKEPKPKKKKKKQEGGSDEEEESDDYVPRKKGEHPATLMESGPLFKTRFWRVVLDEAHFIRNSKTRAAKAVWELDSIHRWCLTGTLIVNSLDDIFVHLKFLCISPSREWKHFQGHISKIQKRRPKLAMKRAQVHSSRAGSSQG
jgi:SNF2 family DNA or RNA helicase